MTAQARSVTSLGVLADEQAERNPKTTSTRGRRAGGGKPTSKPLVSNGRPTRRYELVNPAHAADDVAALYTSFPVITLGSIKGMTINIEESELETKWLIRDIDPDCLTQPGDIILSLSAPFASACIDEQTQGLFIPNTCAVIRMDDETRKILDPWFLTGYLNRSVVKDGVLGNKATKGAWKTLRIEDLRNLEIDLPPIEAQKALGEAIRIDVNNMRRNLAMQQSREKLVDEAYAKARALCREVGA